MKKDDKLDSSYIGRVKEDYSALQKEHSRLTSAVKARRELERKLEYHLGKLADNRSSLEHWEKIINVATTLCKNFNEPISSLWFRNRLIDFIDSVPDEAQTTPEFCRIIQSIDLYRLQEEAKFVVGESKTEPEYSAYVQKVRNAYRNTRVVFIGGTPQNHMRERLEAAFDVELYWEETDHGDSLDRFQSILSDEKTSLFLAYIPWCSHKHSEEFSDYVKRYGKDFVRLRKGTNPEQIAQAICSQMRHNRGWDL
ncbi:MAG: hypothetical protein HUK22_08535 [Thermoguttaceae bacterium]|nr:hypothetical protein [Thermoguttaceae bacterium]